MGTALEHKGFIYRAGARNQAAEPSELFLSICKERIATIHSISRSNVQRRNQPRDKPVLEWKHRRVYTVIIKRWAVMSFSSIRPVDKYLFPLSSPQKK